MDVELANDAEELIRDFGDRIEEIERTIIDDEDFCNKDIDATYQEALKYLKNFQNKFYEKLTELENKLDQIRTENINITKQNKKQFDDEIEIINQLFSSGKHQEALDKFNDYEKCFQQRTTIIRNIPKLYMNNIDINQYFSIDKPLITPQISLNINTKQNLLDNIKQTKNDLSITTTTNDEYNDENEYELIKPCFDIRFKRSISQQIVKDNHVINKELQSPLSIPSSHPTGFSTRLAALSSTKSLPTVEHDLTPIKLSKKTNHRNYRENIQNNVQIRSTPSSPNIVLLLVHSQISNIKTSKGDGLSLTYVTSYQYERNTSLIMTCNQNYIILLRSQVDRLNRWYSIIFERSNPTEQISKWHNLSIKSLGFINENNIYIFTEREFLIYSIDLSYKHYSCILLNDNNYNLEYNNVHLGFGGIVYDKYIYHIYLNIEYHWILSILTVDKINHICDHNLTKTFPNIKRFINICINEQIISFLVQMDSLQYAVMFCSNTIDSKIELKRLIQLSYAGDPLTICSIYIPYIQKSIYFINDPSAKIIHLITNDKYLQSYSIIAHALYSIENNQELILTSNDGIYSININEQQNFFSKFH